MAFSDDTFGTLSGVTALKPGSIATIYAIRCKRNGYRYVGATGTSVARRWQAHHAAMRVGKHGSRKLQAAWDRFGEDAFVVDVLEDGVAHARAARREAHWIRRFAPRVFNIGDPLDLGTHSQKRYVVTDPTGREFNIVNLSRFCRERGLTSPNMVEVARCRKPSHRGWRCRPASMSRVEWEAGQAKLKADRRARSKFYKGGYLVTDPAGRVQRVEAITPWAQAHALDAGALIRVARGAAQHHHGFKVQFAATGGT